MNIVTLTLSAALDIHCEASMLRIDHENIASVIGIDAGGKGINISKALKAMNTDSTAIAVLGDENADDFSKILEGQGIFLEKIIIPGRIRENITIHTENGKETRISFTGAKAPENLISEIERKLDGTVNSETLLTMTGRVPDGISIEDVKHLLKKLKAKGARIIIDSRSFTLDDLKEVKPFLIKPNEEEIASYMECEVSDLKSASAAACALRSFGIENVMISLGNKGAVLAAENAVYEVEAPIIQAVSTIGAGDSSIGGILYALKNGEDFAKALKTAVAFGTAACLTEGTKPPKKEDVLRFIDLIK